jgi:hypothetical protein
MDDRPDPAALQRRFALPLMTRDKQQNPVSCRNRPLQRMIDRLPGSLKTMAVQIKRSIGCDSA